MLSLKNRLATGILHKNIYFHTNNGTQFRVRYYRSTASVKLTPHDVSDNDKNFK